MLSGGCGYSSGYNTCFAIAFREDCLLEDVRHEIEKDREAISRLLLENSNDVILYLNPSIKKAINENKIDDAIEMAIDEITHEIFWFKLDKDNLIELESNIDSPKWYVTSAIYHLDDYDSNYLTDIYMYSSGHRINDSIDKFNEKRFAICERQSSKMEKYLDAPYSYEKRYGD